MTSATSESHIEPGEKPGQNTPPQPPVLTFSCRMVRSPSHESITSDLSLFPTTQLTPDDNAAGGGGGGKMRLVTFKSCTDDQVSPRGPSPNPLKPPRPPDIPEIFWFEEENDLIKSCAALSSALGFQKSFSTSDISNLPSPDETSSHPPRNAVSDLALSAPQRSGYFLDHSRLDHASRSCSTWVAVGDVASASQLPSPHGGHSAPTAPTTVPPPPMFTAADFIRSVNKKVRQNYIRRRLLTTYKALERLSQSAFNLDRLELQAVSLSEKQTSSNTHLTVPGTKPLHKPVLPPTTVIRAGNLDNLTNKNLPVSLRDVERDRGIPLTKYERNMMIFNWLHTLEDTESFEGATH